jgi:hypothetical protein
MKKRVFKLKTFARWAKKLLNDEQLCAAAKEIIKGQYEANLGRGLCKKRIAMSGQGKSGSIRTLVAIESSMAIFYIAGRQKSDAGTDFNDANIAQAQLLGQALQASNSQKLDQLVENGALLEICHDC